jgi:hypothetical protein
MSTKRTVLTASLVAALVGCGASSGSKTPSLNQTWVEASAATSSGQGLTFTSDGKYEHQVISVLSANTFDDEIELGTFTLSPDGHTMTLTPEQWTCSGNLASYTATVSFTGGNLVFAVSGTVLELEPDTATASQGQITEGCFTTNGFVANALAPVSP